MTRLAHLLCLLASALLAHAGPLEDFCQAAYTNGTHSAAIVHARLFERAQVVTNQTRSAGIVADEVALHNLITAGANPLISTNVYEATAFDARAALVAQRLDNRFLAANNDTKAVAALLLSARIQALEARLARRGGDPYGPLARQTTETVVLDRRGLPLWRTLGLARAPTEAEVRAALKPTP